MNKPQNMCGRVLMMFSTIKCESIISSVIKIQLIREHQGTFTGDKRRYIFVLAQQTVIDLCAPCSN